MEVKEFAAVGLGPGNTIQLRIQFDPPKDWEPPRHWKGYPVHTLHIGEVLAYEHK